MDTTMIAIIATVLALLASIAYFFMGSTSGKRGAPDTGPTKEAPVKTEPAATEKLVADKQAEEEAAKVAEREKLRAEAEQRAADATARAPVEKDGYMSLISSSEYENPFKVDPQMLSFLVGSKDDEIKRIVTITNTTPERAVFKVKTNNPKRYLVKPSITFVAANETSQIEITLREREVDKIANEMKEKGRQRATVTDKFLIQWMNVDKKFYYDEAYFHLVKEASWIEKAQKLIKSVPKEEQKKRFKFVRLKVQYELPQKPAATDLPTTPEETEESQALD